MLIFAYYYEKTESAAVFARAAELFGLFSAPLRLQILVLLCTRERSVTELKGRLGVQGPNVSQHLSVLYKARVIARRRNGVHMNRLVDGPGLQSLCRAVCDQVEAQPSAISVPH
jgi:ArsR family transcriptional regulator